MLLQWLVATIWYYICSWVLLGSSVWATHKQFALMSNMRNNEKRNDSCVAPLKPHSPPAANAIQLHHHHHQHDYYYKHRHHHHHGRALRHLQLLLSVGGIKMLIACKHKGNCSYSYTNTHTHPHTHTLPIPLRRHLQVLLRCWCATCLLFCPVLFCPVTRNVCVIFDVVANVANAANSISRRAVNMPVIV